MCISLPGSSVHGVLQARVLVGCHFLLQGIFLTQGSNLGFPYCRQILYHLSHRDTYQHIIQKIKYLCVFSPTLLGTSLCGAEGSLSIFLLDLAFERGATHLSFL